MAAGNGEVTVASCHALEVYLSGSTCHLLHHECALLVITDIGGRASCAGFLQSVSRRDTGDHNRKMRRVLVLWRSAGRVASLVVRRVHASTKAAELEGLPPGRGGAQAATNGHASG